MDTAQHNKSNIHAVTTGCTTEWMTICELLMVDIRVNELKFLIIQGRV